MKGKRKSVVALIIKDKKVLIGRKRVKKGKSLSGRWHIPGGGVKKKENRRKALIREMREELNVVIEVGDYIGRHKTAKGTIVSWFLCSFNSFQLVAGSDLSEVKFVSGEEALKLCFSRCKEWPKKVKGIISGLGLSVKEMEEEGKVSSVYTL